MPRKKQTRQTNKKGTVAVGSRNGMLRLRWTHQSRAYQLSMGLPDNPLNRLAAQRLADQIKADISAGHFDPTLAKYLPQAEQTEALTTEQLFQQFIQHRRAAGTSGQAISTRYSALAANLRRFGKDIHDEQVARQFIDLLRSRQSTLVANQNLSLLKGFGGWAVQEHHWPENFFAAIPRLKGCKSVNHKRLPLTAEQVNSFLDAIKTDRYYWSYHDFCLALFYLGVRPSEAAGIRWRHIDWQRRVVTICEAMARAEDGRSAGYARQRKGTKTGSIREIELRPRLYTCLQGRFTPDAKPDDLVFTSPRGLPIDDHAFSQRIWKRICKKIGIDRVPYAARHGLGSHLLQEGASIAQVAGILGNTPETTARHYSHMIDRPQMPDF